MTKLEFARSWVAGESLLDTAFQILKAAAFMELGFGNEVGTKLMSEWAPPWLMSMDKLDKRKKYAWPHAELEGVSSFRLDDHVWIWRALKSLEKNNHRTWGLISKKVKDANELGNVEIRGEITFNQLSKFDVARLRKTFASEIVQREVAKRFTTKNDVLQKRMLAVSRSPRETRFLLHSRDTALFYDEMFDFFEDDIPLKELWKSTLDCQAYHDENQESTWETILRHALCIVMGTRRLKINNKSSDELVRAATNVLFRSSGPSGFFPGILRSSADKSWETPISAESERDSYYHASFEIPYILFTHAKNVLEAFDRPTSPEDEVKASKPNHNTRLGDTICSPWLSSILQHPQPEHDTSLSPGETDQRQRLMCLLNLLSHSEVSFHDHHEACQDGGEAAKHQQVTMKKSIPFNHLIDSSNIVKVEDEWMFNYPDFFTRQEILEKSDYEDAQRELNYALRHLENGSKHMSYNR